MIIVVRKCSDCPFCSQGEPARCNLSTPKHRPLESRPLCVRRRRGCF